jgi:hypothetical protein
MQKRKRMHAHSARQNCHVIGSTAASVALPILLVNILEKSNNVISLNQTFSTIKALNDTLSYLPVVRVQIL